MKLLSLLPMLAVLAISCQSTANDRAAAQTMEEVASATPEVRYYMIADT